mmetsp:Transcript_22891/g.43218  ORF Transcript_22891/g.43218 Transcript_22891/m.43218 type:complete len:81 (-) Transcript_22891:8-250(-)
MRDTTPPCEPESNSNEDDDEEEVEESLHKVVVTHRIGSASVRSCEDRTYSLSNSSLDMAYGYRRREFSGNSEWEYYLLYG